MRKIGNAGIAALIACASLLTTACDDDDNNNVQPSPVSYVALYNASPDAPDLSIVVDNRQINSYPFEYGDYTGYLRFYTGERNLKFEPFGANNTVVDTTITFEDDRAYSIFVVDEYNNADVLILDDNTDAPAAGKAKVRFINLSPDADAVQLMVDGEDMPVIGSQDFKEASDFTDVDADNYNFRITSDSNNELELNVPDIDLQAGWFYTIVVRGYAEPASGNTNVLSAEVIVN